jgi:hypothetical protein
VGVVREKSPVGFVLRIHGSRIGQVAKDNTGTIIRVL